MSQIPSNFGLTGLPTAGQLYGQEMQAIQGFGQQQQADLQQNYQNALGMGMQQLAQSGLGGTSVAPSMRMGYMKQYQQALSRLNDQLTQTKLGAAQTFGLGGISAQQGQQQISNAQQLGQGQLGIAAENANTNAGYLGLAQQQAQQQTAAPTDTTGYNWQPMGMQYSDLFSNASSLFPS